MGCLQSKGSDGQAAVGAAGARLTAEMKPLAEKKPPNDATKLTREEKKVLLAKTQVADLDGETVVRKPGDINGWDFSLDNCKNCQIMIFDRIAALNGDDCENCDIVIGPCSSSVFIRNFRNCRIAVACQQFRTRDCSDCTILMFSQTRPIIEKSRNLQFGCWSVAYPALMGQLNDSGMSPFCNPWTAIHDFTPGPMSYSILSEAEQAAAAAKMRGLPPYAEVGADFCADVVPCTYGKKGTKGRGLEGIGAAEATLQAVFLENLCGSVELLELVHSLLAAADTVRILRTDALHATAEFVAQLSQVKSRDTTLDPAFVTACKAGQCRAVTIEVAGSGSAIAAVKAKILESVVGAGVAVLYPPASVDEILFPSFEDGAGN